MNFLFPSFLFASALIAVPIIIHLFNFQRSKKVYFTNIEFLREVKAVSVSRNRIRNLLILLCRCLFIVALVFAFAQPFLPNKNADAVAKSNNISVYVDNSFSMQNEQDGKKLLDIGISYAEKITQLFPKSAVFSLLTNDFDGSQRYFSEASKITDKLNGLEFSNNGRDLKSVYSRQLSALQTATSAKNNHIFWISDFQKYPQSQLEKLTLDSTNLFYLLPLQASEVSNLYVDSLWLQNPFIRANENNTLFVKINHFGASGVSDKIVKFFIENRQVSAGTVSLDPNGNATLALNFTVTEGGEKRCKITLDDYPVLFDNDYFFTLRVAPEIKIVHITADKDDYVPKVFANEPFFKVESFSTNAVDYNKFSTADLVVLQGIEAIDNALQTALRNFLQKGGTLCIFPAFDSDVPSYTNVVGINLRKLQPFNPLPLNPPDAKNPFFDGVFEKITPTMDMPAAQVVMDWGGAGQRLLIFRNEQIFLSALTSTANPNSKIYLFSSPLELAYSNFAKHAIFVPVMYKIALTSRTQTDRLAYSFAENNAEIDLEEVGKNDIFKLVLADSAAGTFEVIPSQRFSNGKLVLSIPKTDMPAGNYQIIRSADQKNVGTIAFNYDDTESRFENDNTESLKKLFAGKKNVQVFDNVELTRFGAEFKSRNIITPLWRYALFAALFFILCEILLIRLWKT